MLKTATTREELSDFITDDDDSIVTLTNASEQNSPESASSLSLWAEDSIRQNHEEWKRLECQFYREIPLPEDKALKNEILEWNRAFPHLRIIGKPVEIHYSTTLRPSNPHHCEIFAQHPQTPSGKVRQDFLESGLEECLIIKPGACNRPSPAVQRRNATIYRALDNKLTTTIPGHAVKNNALVEKIKMIELDKSGKETINTVFYRCYEPVATFTAEADPKKPDPEFNVFFNRVVTEPKKPNPRFSSSVTLPNIDSPPPSVIGRSISACAVNRKHVKVKTTPLPGLKPKFEFDD